MKKTISLFNIICIGLLVLLIGCTTAPPTVYADPPYHAPYFDDVHESQVSAMALGYEGTAGTLGFRFSHMFRNCMILGVQAFRAERPGVYEGEKVISDTDSVGNKISYYEICGGPNYILNRHTNLSYLAGIGYGNLSATYAGRMNFTNGIQQLEEQFSTRFIRPFVQANLIWSAKIIEAGAMVRFAHFSTFDPIEYSSSSRFNDNFIGYGLFVRWALEFIQFETQISQSYSLNKTIDSKYYSTDNSVFAINVMLVR